MLAEKAKTLAWFARRPAFWAHAGALGLRKLLTDHDGASHVAAATEWASQNSVSTEEALMKVGLASDHPGLDGTLIEEGNRRASKSAVVMGGAGALDLLHKAVAASGAVRIVETGVAYGWSSLAILAAIQERPDARLVSVDMPYPKMDNEPFVGIVVPDSFRKRWLLVREPDRYGLDKAIASFGGTIDLCHYDSDKSWWGRKFAYARIWAALRPGGIFISDDLQDNLYFKEFVPPRASSFAVIKSDGKYVGIARKPS